MPALYPPSIFNNYEIREWRHASAILATDFPVEFAEVMQVLDNFRLLRSEITAAGKNKSPIARRLDTALYGMGWVEKSFDTRYRVDGVELLSPTHSVDCFKNRVALEVEWNNKDPFYDRDLNNFRLLFDLRVISVGIIVTRCDALQGIFNSLGKGDSYGMSTTHMSKLLPRIEGGGGGGCPILVFGISPNLYVAD